MLKFCVVCYLDLPPSEQGVVQRHGCLHGVLICKLDIGESFRMAIKLVTEDRHPELIRKHIQRTRRKQDLIPGLSVRTFDFEIKLG